MASGQSSAASSSNPNRAQALSRGILMPCSWQLPPPSVFNDTAPETPHNLSTTVGNVQVTSFFLIPPSVKAVRSEQQGTKKSSVAI